MTFDAEVWMRGDFPRTDYSLRIANGKNEKEVKALVIRGTSVRSGEEGNL